MRLPLLIISFFYACLSFGQDSLQVDTNINVLPSLTQGENIKDSSSTALKKITKKKKKQKKRSEKFNVKEESASSKILEPHEAGDSGKNNGVIVVVILIVVLIVVLAYSRSFFSTTYKSKTPNAKDDDFVSDYLSRVLLSRRDYYRNVYLKSEAWKRKRYVVLKRDNWRCVYCGGKATEVHHTRYARKNIGKEPIEWLVSICRACHHSKHN
jgi:hypothetical protein